MRSTQAARSVSILFSATLAFAIACAGPGSVFQPRISDEEQRAYDAALTARERDPAAAERRLEQFLRAYPRGPLSDDAGLALAEIAEERRDAATALRRYYFVVRTYPNGDRTDSARVRAAHLELERGDETAAAALMSRARPAELSEADRRIGYRVLADVEQDAAKQVRWLSKLRGLAEGLDRIERIDAELDELLARMTAEELERAVDAIAPEIPAARALLQIAQLAIDAGDTERAERAWSRAAGMPMAQSYAMRLDAARGRLSLRESDPGSAAELPRFDQLQPRDWPYTASAVGTLGVVLPLSGPFARFGEETLEGILLAAGVFGPRQDAPRMRVVVRDTAGTPQRAAAAVRELAAFPDVTAIIGPLLSEECEAAADAAEAEGVPLLTLTARREIASPRPHVFRLRNRPEEETDILVDHAMRKLGAQRFAILYPRDAYGRGLRRLFWDAVEERGGEVVGIASYEPDATDFGQPIRQLLGYALLGREEQKAIDAREDLQRRARRLPPEQAAVLRDEARAMTGPEGELLPPIVDFDALFIPESHQKVVLIAPQLAFHEAGSARLLGPNGWYHPDLLSIARKHVEGALFTTHFYAESRVEFVRAFAERYGDAFEHGAGAFAAQGFDAANLVLVQLARGGSSRDAVREGVLSTDLFAGVTGVMSMSPDGNARKRPFLLGVERGELVPQD